MSGSENRRTDVPHDSGDVRRSEGGSDLVGSRRCSAEWPPHIGKRPTNLISLATGGVGFWDFAGRRERLRTWDAGGSH